MTQEDNTEGTQTDQVPIGWTDIKGIYYTFHDHCDQTKYPGVHKQLRLGLSEKIDELDALFTDATRTEFKPDPDVISILRQAIIENIKEEADLTQHPERIDTIIRGLPIFYRKLGVRTGVIDVKIKNRSRLEEAFEHTRSCGESVVVLHLNINNLEFLRGSNFRAKNFDHIGTTAHPYPSDDIEVEETTGNEEPTPTSAMMDMMKTLVDSMAQQNIRNNSMPYQHNTSPEVDFDIRGTSRLPPEVRERNQVAQKETRQMTRQEMTPFTTEIKNLHVDPSGNTMRTSLVYYSPPNKIVTRDGHYFWLYRDTKSVPKNFTAKPPIFDTDLVLNTVNIRRWYKEFVKHCQSNGVYTTPYYCFRREADAAYGFTVGYDNDEEQFDLPGQLAEYVTRWSNLIGTALQDVFPKGSEERRICRYNGTDGYMAIRRIVTREHPAFHEYGQTMGRLPPLQAKGMSIYEHLEVYKDFLSVKAYTQNISTNLDDIDEMMAFLLTCRYGNQILSQSREERRSNDPFLKDKWTKEHVADTITALLRTSVNRSLPPFEDMIKESRIPSPVKHADSPQPQPFRHSNRQNKSPRNGHKGKSTPPSKKSINVLNSELEPDIQEIENQIPTTAKVEPAILSIYRLGIHSVRTAGSFDINQKCLVCQEAGHTFDECPILNNHKLLKKFHINFCSLCRKVNKEMNDNVGTSAIHQIGATTWQQRTPASRSPYTAKALDNDKESISLSQDKSIPPPVKAGGGETKIDGDGITPTTDMKEITSRTEKKMDIQAADLGPIKHRTQNRIEDVTILRMDIYDDIDPEDEEEYDSDLEEEERESTHEDMTLVEEERDSEEKHTVNRISNDGGYHEDEDEIDQEAIRAQIDTGAKVSVTNLKYALHNYIKYGEDHNSPIRLTGAIDDGIRVRPEGKGYLRIPTGNSSRNVKEYIDVETYYSPLINSTLVSENTMLRSSVPTKEYDKYDGQTLSKKFNDTSKNTGRVILINHHKQRKSRDVKITGVLLGGQYYTHPLVIPNLDKDDPEANEFNSLEYALEHDDEFKNSVEEAGNKAIKIYRVHKYVELAEILSTMPNCYKKYREDINALVNENIPIHTIRARTEKMLWHQRLGHPCDEYLYNAHKHIKGVPKFERETSVLDECPTCIQAKQTKEPAGKNSTKKASKPYQGLSIDFSFSGTRSKNEERRLDFEGLNGETSYVLITDHYTGMHHGDTRLSKAPPVEWLRKFLTIYAPNCIHKYVYMDQGGELFNSPDVKNLFSEFGYDILPTGADNSRQNGPVERAHRDIGNKIRSILHGGGLDIKFWPYAFYHVLRLNKAIPQKGQQQSPIELSTRKREDFTNLRTFGCRVWVRPPKARKAKYKANSRKGIFLGYAPHTTKNILWYDMETNRVKIATHARFDEGMNDLPIDEIPPNVQQLQRSDDGVRIPADNKEIHTDLLRFHVSPFPDIVSKKIQISPDKKIGIDVREDHLSKRAYVSDIQKNSPASKIHSTLQATKHKLQGAYIISINGIPVYTAEEAESRMNMLRKQGVAEIQIDFAPSPKLSAKQQSKATNEFGLFHPNTKASKILEHSNEDLLNRKPIGLPKTSKKGNNIGQRIAKYFDGTLWFGTVTESWKLKGRKQWYVVYDDGDDEDLEDHELKRAIKLYKKKRSEDNRGKMLTRVSKISKLMAEFNRTGTNQLIPEEGDDLDGSVPTVDMNSLRAICNIKHELYKEKRGIVDEQPNQFDSDKIPIEFMDTVINAIQSQATTPEEQALGYFTRRKLKTLDTWPEWLEGERKQLNQFEDLGMYGEPIYIKDKKNNIILRPHWQYNIKRNGTRRSRLCCNGSKKAAPLLHSLALTYSSCVEHPIQRLFLAISANLNLKIYGGDAKDAYGHSPGPEIPTYMTIDDAYAEWYEEKHGVKLDRRMVLPVLKALQGHPESGRLWEGHITKILNDLGFTSTTHDKTIYRSKYTHEDGKVETIYLLRQVDDFALACKDESTAKDIYDKIGKALQTEKEDKPPFAYLGLVNDFNGVDVDQTNEYIEISCGSYIDRVLRSHGWETGNASKPGMISPMSKDALEQVFKQTGPKEGTPEHQALEDKAGFSYRTLLGELMFCYISCRCDIGYAITLLSKFSTSPSQYHYSCLKGVAKYLRSTKKWGIRYKRGVKRTDLQNGNFEDIPKTESGLPNYPADVTKGKLVCFVDAAYANDYKKRRSTTGFAFTYSGGAIVYRSKAQSITALSSTEAELVAAVTAAKTAKFIRSVLNELGFEQTEPTPIYEDNKPTIDIVNSGKPTQRSRHMDIRFFAIQDWLQNKEIIMHHISGVINPADDLTKPLGWVLHTRHARYMMGHCNYPLNKDVDNWTKENNSENTIVSLE